MFLTKVKGHGTLGVKLLQKKLPGPPFVEQFVAQRTVALEVSRQFVAQVHWYLSNRTVMGSSSNSGIASNCCNKYRYIVILCCNKPWYRMNHELHVVVSHSIWSLMILIVTHLKMIVQV